MARTPEQFNPIDNIRRELDDKIHGVAEKVDRKFDTSTFCWVIGILVTTLIAILGIMCSWISGTHYRQEDKIETIQQRVATLEARLGDNRKSN